MHGIDLVLPDFTYLRENADRIDGCVATHGHEDHVGALSFLLRELSLPDLRLGAHARPGPQPHRGGRPARPHRARSRSPTASAARSGRSTSSSSRSPTRCPTRFAIAFHTPQGVDPALRRLQARPHAGRRPAHRPRPHRRDRRRPRASACCCPTRPTPRSTATRRASAASARCCATCSHEHDGRRIITASFASHIHRIQQIADAAIAVGPRRRHARAVDEEERAAGPRARAAAHPRRVAGRHRGHRRLRRRARCA